MITDIKEKLVFAVIKNIKTYSKQKDIVVLFCCLSLNQFKFIYSNKDSYFSLYYFPYLRPTSNVWWNTIFYLKDRILYKVYVPYEAYCIHWLHFILCRAVDKGNYIFGNIVTNNLPSLYYLYQDVTKIINSEETTVVDVKSQ